MILVHGIPVYWGVEKNAPDRTFFSRATLNEVLPPYRESYWAFRLRVSHRHWLHVGVFRYRPEVTPWGIEVAPEEIGNWGRDQEKEDTEGAPSAYDWALRTDEFGGDLPGDRGGDGENGSVLRGPDRTYERYWLAAGRDGGTDVDRLDFDPGAA